MDRKMASSVSATVQPWMEQRSTGSPSLLWCHRGRMDSPLPNYSFTKKKDRERDRERNKTKRNIREETESQIEEVISNFWDDERNSWNVRPRRSTSMRCHGRLSSLSSSSSSLSSHPVSSIDEAKIENENRGKETTKRERVSMKEGTTSRKLKIRFSNHLRD